MHRTGHAVGHVAVATVWTFPTRTTASVREESYIIVVSLSSRYIYNRMPVLQISMFRSSSQDLVAASGRRSPAKPPGALYIMQSTTTCCTLCVMFPQAHMADSWAPQSFNVSPTRAVPHRRRMSCTHCLRGRSAPGGSTGLD